MGEFRIISVSCPDSTGPSYKRLTGFNSEEVSTIIKSTLESVIGAAAYRATSAEKWTAEVSEQCVNSLIKLGKPFKYIVNCTLVQKSSSGLNSLTCCYWDQTADDPKKQNSSSGLRCAHGKLVIRQVVASPKLPTFPRAMPSQLAQTTADYFPSQVEKPDHSFQVGFLLEAVHPQQPDHVAPATIIAINPANNTFIVGLDDWSPKSTSSNFTAILSHPCTFVSHAGDARILPPGLAALRGIPLVAPASWKNAALAHGLPVDSKMGAEFDWLQYMALCSLEHTHNSRLAPPYLPSAKYFKSASYRKDILKASSNTNSSYSVGTLVEAVPPFTPNRKNLPFRPAVVTRVLGNLVWVSFEGTHTAVMFDASSAFLCPLPMPSAVQPPPISENPVMNTRSRKKSATPLVQVRIHAERCYRGHKIAEQHLRQLPRILGPGRPEEVLHRLLRIMSRLFAVKRGIFVPLSEWHPSTYGSDAETHVVRRPICWFARGPPCRVWVHSVALPCSVTGAVEFCKRLSLLLGLCPGFISASAVGEEVVVLQEGSFHQMCSFLCGVRQTPGVYSDERRFTVKVKGSLAYPLQIRGHPYDHPLDLADSASSTDSSEAASSGCNNGTASSQPNRIVTRGKKFVVPLSLRPTMAKKRLSVPQQLDAATPAKLQRTNLNMPAPANDVVPLPPTTTGPVVSRNTTYLKSHPRNWSTEDLVAFLLQHATPTPVCDWARREKLDGSAFLLLDCPMMTCLGLKAHIVKHLGNLIIQLRKAVIVM